MPQPNTGRAAARPQAAGTSPSANSSAPERPNMRSPRSAPVLATLVTGQGRARATVEVEADAEGPNMAVPVQANRRRETGRARRTGNQTRRPPAGTRSQALLPQGKAGRGQGRRTGAEVDEPSSPPAEGPAAGCPARVGPHAKPRACRSPGRRVRQRWYRRSRPLPSLRAEVRRRVMVDAMSRRFGLTTSEWLARSRTSSQPGVDGPTQT